MPLFTMRCSDVELDELRRLAAQEGVSMSGLVRRRVFGPPRVVPPVERRREVHQHRASSAGPVSRCTCGAVKGTDGVWR